MGHAFPRAVEEHHELCGTEKQNKTVSLAARQYSDTAPPPKDLYEAICFHGTEALEFSP
jgi:hypothetical protein